MKIRELISTNSDLASRLDELERKQSESDGNLVEIYSMVKRLIDEPVKNPKKIGFSTQDPPAP